MIRLFLIWLIFTTLLFGIRYFVDAKTKVEAKHWTVKFAVQGVIVGVVLSLIVFLERL